MLHKSEKESDFGFYTISLYNSLTPVSEHLPTYFSNCPEELYKINLIIKECPEEILINMAIVLKISMSSCNTCYMYFFSNIFINESKYMFR
jgi:uncharacterized Fe-S center protein